MESRSSILRISDTKTLELIELYEKEECLWNTQLPNYRNRANRYAAAERIANKLAVDKFDARHVIIKFKNLRNSYCQELKKVATSHALGEDPVYKPRVFWFLKMDSFLRPHLQQLHPWDYDIQQKEDKDEIYLDELPVEFVQLPKPDDVVMVKTEVNDDDVNDEIHVPKKRPGSKCFNDDSDNSSCGTYTHTEAKIRHTQPRGDCFDTFGKYVSSMLRMMPTQKAMELQPKIVTLLTSINFDSFDEQVSQSDEPS